MQEDGTCFERNEHQGLEDKHSIFVKCSFTPGVSFRYFRDLLVHCVESIRDTRLIIFSGRATTYFIGKYPELMRSDPRLEVNPHKILGFLAEGKVNGFSHPGAVGPPPAAREPIIPQLPDGVQVYLRLK